MPTEFLWTVDEYMDSLRKRAYHVVRSAEVQALRWGRKLLVFESEGEAGRFMVDRAQARLNAAQSQLRKEQNRLKGLKNKFEGKF